MNKVAKKLLPLHYAPHQENVGLCGQHYKHNKHDTIGNYRAFLFHEGKKHYEWHWVLCKECTIRAELVVLAETNLG